MTSKIFLPLFLASILLLQAQDRKDPIDLAMDAAMEQNGSTAGMVDAITAANQQWEAKLNTVYKDLRRHMPPEEFSALQQAQRAWLTYREKQLQSYDSTYSKMDGTMWIPIHQSAIMEVTKQRAQELEHILSLLRERVSSTNPDPVVNATALSICEEKTRQFLKSDYIDDPAIAKNYMTTEFAALWLKACNPPEGETIYWGCDPIMETQDTDPKLLSLGPAEAVGCTIRVPVVYKHQGKAPFTKSFLFVEIQNSWRIADILTLGIQNAPESEFEKLKKNL
jgi:uncharacterized protein YecT (DUF1311 family)